MANLREAAVLLYAEEYDYLNRLCCTYYIELQISDQRIMLRNAMYLIRQNTSPKDYVHILDRYIHVRLYFGNLWCRNV